MKGVSSLKEIKFDKDYCKGCGLCINFCPKSALTLSEDINEFGYRYAMLKEGGDCIACGICRTVCPDIAIEFV